MSKKGKGKKGKGKKEPAAPTAAERAAKVAALERQCRRDVAAMLWRFRQEEERLRRDGFARMGDGPYGPGLWAGVVVFGVLALAGGSIW